MKKIFVKAYAVNNLGDDLFIYMLAQRYPQSEFLIACSKNYRQPFQSLPNIRYLHNIPFIDGVLARLGLPLRVKRTYHRKMMAQCNATVHIGGSLFIEHQFPHSEIGQYAKDIQASQQYYLLGSNFGPFEDQTFLDRFHQLFTQMEDVCVRDEYTYNLFKDIPQVRLAPDVVFGLEVKSELTENTKKRIVISVIRLEGRPELEHLQEVYEDKIEELADGLIEQGFEVVLMSFCQLEGDQEVVERLASKMNHRVSTYNYNGNLQEALEVIGSSQGVVASRFHALILAWVFQKAVYPLAYSGKMTQVIEDVDFEGGYTAIRGIAKLDTSAVINQLLDCPSIDLARYADEADDHFAKLDERLLNNISFS